MLCSPSSTVHMQVLNRLRKVAADKGRTIATMLDTKGPEIRTAMLKDHSPVEIQVGFCSAGGAPVAVPPE